LQSGHSALIEIIRAEIHSRGPVSFSWFMQQALYHPEHGYYASGRAAIGRKGDYFTNVSVGPLFGRLLCAQFVEIWKQLGPVESFTIVEQGAHDGQFAHAVLVWAQQREPEFFAALRYRIVEPFTIWRDRQGQTLKSFRDKIEWRESIEPFTGVHFSNELVDAMPIDLRGKLVDLNGGELVFVESANPNATTNQAALDWIGDVSRSLVRGYIIAIDYGDRRAWQEEMEKPEQRVQVRMRHRNLDSPFHQIGYADITARIDWSSIIDRARQNGLRIAGFTDQHHFLTGILSSWPALVIDAKSKRELQTLLHPERLGRTFQVLALAKNVSGDAPLAGFTLARDAEAKLLL
jgi:SAM-dependent MidA family methyltransferase